MKLSNLLKIYDYIFYDGPMETRVEYGWNLPLDKEMSIFRLLETQKGKDALRELYRRDIEVAISANVPIILNAPTFRASKEHCQRLALQDDLAYINLINQKCIDFVRSISSEYKDFAEKIVITAPIGPKFAGFTPDKITDLEAEINYHSEQINAVVTAGVDLISIAAMPGGVECIGAAIAASQTNCDYSVGFVLNKEGALLDGMSINQLIDEIENATNRKPIGYIIGCTHPSVAKVVLSENPKLAGYIIGIKANGSSKPPEALLKLTSPEADSPCDFADDIYQLQNYAKLKIIGGCCGTDAQHLKALIDRFVSS
ncbi:MAG: hypothetical protein EP298_04880 [Gammaproteobacteria bacterium]|nr:MAG: hypothetical protein EP298_04880 [Gammaproteobacteria bacterium]UTW42536.1 homocysteine S-methyltransferase family protein [bacterium SCSIO 12844]